MSEEVNLLILIFGSIALAIGYLVYFNRPDLHNCGLCGRFLSVKAHRYWYERDGKQVPFCTKCHNKNSK